jgi:hypothetical protein
MCVPVLGAAIAGAAGIAGGVMRAKQQQAYVDSVNKAKMEAFNLSRIARAREDRRQDRFDKKGFRKVKNTIRDTGFDAQAGNAATAEQSFIDQTDVTGAEGYGLNTEGTSAEIKSEVAKSIADNVAKMRGHVGNVAKLSSYGSATGKVQQRLQKNADILKILNNKREGSLAVYQNLESQFEPAYVEPPDTTFADVLTGVGGMFAKPYG